MSEPIAIQAPQPSSTGSSRIGTAGFAIGIAIVALVVVAAVIGNALVPQDPFVQDLGNRLKPPFKLRQRSSLCVLARVRYTSASMS
jgi:peptide/nickel transport system permease protein